MARLLSGKEVAASLKARLTERVERLTAAGTVPTLAILRVGERPDDLAYERGAVKCCGGLGIAVRQTVLPESCTQEELLAAIRVVNEDGSVHGCLLLRPLPRHLDEAAACRALAPEKDVDCITPGALAGVFSGSGEGYPPCTAQACLEILDHYGYDPRGKRAVVVGRSLVVGRPVAMLLLARNATVTLCHTKTADLAAECRRAELLVVAAGQAGAVDGGCVSPGQTVIDVGIHPAPGGGLCGDVAFEQAEPVAEAITPVPGGVGAVTTAVLAKHVVLAAERAAGIG